MVNQIRKYMGKPSKGLLGDVTRAIKTVSKTKYVAFKKKINNLSPSIGKLKKNGKLKQKYASKWYWK